MRIEAGQHAVDGFGDELLVFDRLDIIALDAAEHFGEGAQFLDRQRHRRAASRCATAEKLRLMATPISTPATINPN